MSIEDFLKTLTADQLEALVKVKREEENSAKPKKRKQNRNKKTKPEESSIPQPNRPVRQKGKRRKQSGHSNIPKGKKYTKRMPLELGERSNRFEDGDLSDIKNTDQHIIKEDIAHWKGKTPTRRATRSVEYVDAICSKCNDAFSNVLSSLCYKDDSENIFTCDDCIRRG